MQIIDFLLFPAEGMLGNKDLFSAPGRVNRDALAGFIKDIKKNTKLSDEDAAVIAASKVRFEKKLVRDETNSEAVDRGLPAQVPDVVQDRGHQEPHRRSEDHAFPSYERPSQTG